MPLTWRQYQEVDKMTSEIRIHYKCTIEDLEVMIKEAPTLRKSDKKRYCAIAIRTIQNSVMMKHFGVSGPGARMDIIEAKKKATEMLIEVALERQKINNAILVATH